MRTILPFIIVQLLLSFPASAQANPLNTEFPPQITTMWEMRQNYLSRDDLQGAYGTLIVINELKKRLGLKNLTLISQVLLWEAIEWDRKGDSRKKELLLEFSKKFSPDYPPVYFYQARTGWSENPAQIFENIGLTISFLKVYIKDFGYFINGLKTVWITVLVAVFITLFVILGILVVRSFPILGHQIWEWSGRKVNRWNQWGLIGIFALLPVFMGLKPFWIIFVWVSLTWFWLSRSERGVLISLFLVLFGMMYSASHWGALFTENERDDLKIMVEAINGEWISSARIAGKSGEDAEWPILFALGSALKREGNCPKAIRVYEKVKNKVSDSNRALVENNIGNCYFRLKNYGQAVAAYEKNIQEFPSLVLPYYNLSQTYREQLLFDEGKKIYEKAFEKNGTLISKYSSISQSSPELTVVDANFGQREIWKRLFSVKNETFGNALWAGFTGEIPKGIFVMLFSFWAASILIIGLKESEQSGELRCQTCSNTMCNKCQHFFFDLTVCGNCWESLKIKKVKPILSTGRNSGQKGGNPLLWVFSYVIPGTAHLFLFKSIRGSLWLLGWSMWISLFILNGYALFRVPDGISGVLTGNLIGIWVLGLACFYLLFHFDLKKEFQN